MPNQNFYQPQDDMHLLKCDYGFKSCQPSEKFCRFAYASWCPICDEPRRRSKSECIDVHNRKRSRDTKNKSPKLKNASENMDYLDLRTKLDSAKVRTNLCELPTTYINNCQPKVPSNTANTSFAKFSNFIEPLSYDQSKVIRRSESPPSKDINSIKHDILKNNTTSKHNYLLPQKVEELLAKKYPSLKYNGTTKTNEPVFHKKEQTFKNVKEHDDYSHFRKKAQTRVESPPAKSPLPSHICRDLTQSHNASCPRRHLPTPKSPIRSNYVKESMVTLRSSSPNSQEMNSELLTSNTMYINCPRRAINEIKSRETTQINSSPTKPIKNKQTAFNVTKIKEEIYSAQDNINNTVQKKESSRSKSVPEPKKRIEQKYESDSVNTNISIFSDTTQKQKNFRMYSAPESKRKNIEKHETFLQTHTNIINNIVQKEKNNTTNVASESKRRVREGNEPISLQSSVNTSSNTIRKEKSPINSALESKRKVREGNEHVSLQHNMNINDNIIQKEKSLINSALDSKRRVREGNEIVSLEPNINISDNTTQKEKSNPINSTPELKRRVHEGNEHASLQSGINIANNAIRKEKNSSFNTTPDSKRRIREGNEHVSLQSNINIVNNTIQKEKSPINSSESKRKVREGNELLSLEPNINVANNTIQKEINSSINSASESKRRIRQRSESDNLEEITDDKQIETCTVIPKKAREISPQEKKDLLRSKSAVKVAAIKSRHKLSAIKLRKVKSKIIHSVSSDLNFSDSDYSDSEKIEHKCDTCKQCGDTLPANNFDVISSSTPITASILVSTHTENYEKWPLRPSLFPYVPPYISFKSHDSDPQCLPPGASRYLKWKLSTITPIIIRKTLANTGFRMVRSEYNIKESNDWTGTWGKHLKSVMFQTLKETQKLNHFPGTFQIGRKDRLWKNLQRLMHKYGQKEFGFIPRSFVLPQDLKLLRQAWEKNGCDKWIIKPPAAARGTGVKVIYRWANLPKKKSLVVQQYISNPYLINGSKFDLRLYVLVTSFNPLRIYLYPDGLVRFASTKYSDDISTLCDRYMHLTNYSINKFSSQYTANEDANACKGHKWTLSKLWEYLEKDGVNTKMLWRSLQQLVIKTILSGESSITQLCEANINSRYNCYEVFGVDVLLDERLRPWLLEVNISPSLHSASPLDIHVKGPLVQSLLNLAQFHLPPKISNFKRSPPCLNKDLYSVHLTTRERLKQKHFTEFEQREEYLNDILADLTGDDIRHLLQAEDELTVAGNFERIFPTKHSYHYFQFMEIRYYNRLFDAWEHHYEQNRNAGIKLLQSLCETKIHLLVAPNPVVKHVSAEIEQMLSLEETTSDESIQHTVPIKSEVSPLTIRSLTNDVKQKMINLKRDATRSVTPI